MSSGLEKKTTNWDHPKYGTCKVHSDVTISMRISTLNKISERNFEWVQHANGPEKVFDLQHIASELQIADIFTKGLQGQKFIDLIKLLCSW